MNKGYIRIERDRHNFIVKQPRIMRRITGQTTAKGWRTGTTRFIHLECGHAYNQPASKPVGRTFECIFCEAIWRYKMGDRDLNNVEYALKAVTSETLNEMDEAVRQLSKI